MRNSRNCDGIMLQTNAWRSPIAKHSSFGTIGDPHKKLIIYFSVQLVWKYEKVGKSGNRPYNVFENYCRTYIVVIVMSENHEMWSILRYVESVT